MEILIIGLIAAIAVLVLPRFFGRRHERMLAQFEVLEKRFGLERKITPSRWGKGIAEHHSLRGRYRGYPISIYQHFHGKGNERVDWTSVVMEALFADDLELRIEFSTTDARARFIPLQFGETVFEEEGFSVCLNREDAVDPVVSEAVRDRLRTLARQKCSGAASLSKGFLEYREHGAMEDEATRIRFQGALLLLADLADGVSLYRTKIHKSAEKGE